MNPKKINAGATVERTFDYDGFRQRAGCVVFDSVEEKRVMLVSHTSTDGSWILPAGGVDPGESYPEAAERETHEEAGVKGTLGRLCGYFQNSDKHWRLKLYALYASEYLDYPNWQEGLVRTRKWFTVEEVLHSVTFHHEYVRNFVVHALKTRTQPLSDPPPLIDVQKTSE